MVALGHETEGLEASPDRKAGGPRNVPRTDLRRRVAQRGQRMTSRERFVSMASCSALLSLTAACGGADVAPKSAPSAAPPAETPRDRAEPTTVEEAQDQIARARAELDSRTSARANDEAKKTERAPAKAPAPTTPPQGGASLREESTSTDADSCGHPCRALASMTRAVESLCRMTGENDNRCVEAKRTLTDSRTRIASCNCDAR